ncbi:hypothetical protein [Granulicoccus phenolivorans]|uniref:hypothetical protein n=1 Tax=Granulicoccus phenolivorans TaxID=266854 RepID=UPI00040119E4|nr:hypothetical protein [Granulicoccus phenolivorans]
MSKAAAGAGILEKVVGPFLKKVKPAKKPLAHRAQKGPRTQHPPVDPALVTRRTQLAKNNKDAIAARDELYDSLPPVEPPASKSEVGGMSVAELRQKYGISAAEAREIREGFRQQRDAQAKLGQHSEAMGEQGASNVIHQRGQEPIPTQPGSGAGTFDQMSVTHGPDGKVTDLNVYEAKGGNSPLGARDTPDGRAQQGTTEYLNDVAARDPALADYLAKNPAVREGLQDGSINVNYELVRTRPDGSVSSQPFTIDPSRLTW